MRADSFVVETDVHFPTDTNLLFDAVRKAIETSANLCNEQGLSDWRQSVYNVRQMKKAYRRTQQMKRSTSKDESKRAAREEQIHQAYRDYLDLAEGFVQRARLTRSRLGKVHGVPEVLLVPLDEYIAHAERQIDQIRRRVLNGERIPHEEKVFSIFEPHTEWISKGKAGVLVEFGLRVAVSEDQYGFILNWRVMQKETDEQVAVPLLEDIAEHFPAVKSASFDKGFHSPENQRRLGDIVDFPVLPKKGKRSKARLAEEQDPRFVRLRRHHSGVESAINALEVHGLDVCPDHGIDGFKRYVALAVLGRNVHHLGAILLAEEVEQEKKARRRAA